MTNRRTFIQIVPAAGALLACGAALAADPPMVDPKDAAGLGYNPDATKVDKAKYSKYAAGQACANCALYTGKAGAAAGPCGIFPGKQVAAKGWCNAYAKKA